MPGQRRRKPEELPALPPLVNRLLELRLLREHLAGVAAGGPGHALLVLGESGVGKSRPAVLSALPAFRPGSPLAPRVSA